MHITRSISLVGSDSPDTKEPNGLTCARGHSPRISDLILNTASPFTLSNASAFFVKFARSYALSVASAASIFRTNSPISCVSKEDSKVSSSSDKFI